MHSWAQQRVVTCGFVNQHGELRMRAYVPCNGSGALHVIVPCKPVPIRSGSAEIFIRLTCTVRASDTDIVRVRFILKLT